MASDRVQRQIDRLLDEAEQAITSEDWPTVASRVRSVLAIDPENGDALAYLSATERAMGGSTPQIGSPTAPAPTAAPVLTPAQPASFANGRYQVKRFLGEGGKKKVYLAHDTTLDREVAFALIKTEGLDEIPAPASNERPRPWGDWAPTLTSSPSSTWARRTANPTWSPSSWAAATLKV